MASCLACTQPITEGFIVKTLCGHAFHFGCIDLSEDSTRCLCGSKCATGSVHISRVFHEYDCYRCKKGKVESNGFIVVKDCPDHPMNCFICKQQQMDMFWSTIAGYAHADCLKSFYKSNPWAVRAQDGKPMDRALFDFDFCAGCQLPFKSRDDMIEFSCGHHVHRGCENGRCFCGGCRIRA